MGADQSIAETQLNNYHELEDYYARKLTGTHSSLTNLFSLAEESSCSVSTLMSPCEKAIPHPNRLDHEVTMHSTALPKRSVGTTGSFQKDTSTEKRVDMTSCNRRPTFLPSSKKGKLSEKSVHCVAQQV